MQKILFLDRDGTLVIEPQPDQQLDSLDKLEFYPGVFQWLARIVRELDFKLVMVTNQDGLGTDSFPEETFWPAQEKIIRAFLNEDIQFEDILIDKSLPEDNAPTRKPGTGMLSKYMHGAYDLKGSYVVGDRESDVQLAKNLQCRAIKIGKEHSDNSVLTTLSWEDIYRYLSGQDRCAVVHRKTKETDVQVRVNLDGTGQSAVGTGLGFFDHMLDQVARHSGCDLEIDVSGDLEVDEHHTIEDVALALGEAFREALGLKKGIGRYGFVLPMDESLAQVAIDFSGRPWCVWNATFRREKIGDMPTEMFFHFFKSFSDTSLSTVHISVDGENEHHMIEAIFKGFGRSLGLAIRRDNTYSIPSTKGIL